MDPTTATTEQVVALFRENVVLRKYADFVGVAKIRGEDLQELTDPEIVADVLQVATKLGARTAAEAISQLLDAHRLSKQGPPEKKGPDAVSHIALPHGKRYAAFCSHRKLHSRFGSDSEWLAKATKDFLKMNGLEVFFDGERKIEHCSGLICRCPADNLKSITEQSISEGIEQSCAMLLFLVMAVHVLLNHFH